MDFQELKKLLEIPDYEAFVEVSNRATASRCLSAIEHALWIIWKLSHSGITDKLYETVKPL